MVPLFRETTLWFGPEGSEICARSLALCLLAVSGYFPRAMMFGWVRLLFRVAICNHTSNIILAVLFSWVFYTLDGFGAAKARIYGL